MDLLLRQSDVTPKSSLKIEGSKSETNRLLLLQALYPQIAVENASHSDDSSVMMAALLSASETIDIHHAGTAMRFLTAYFAIQHGRTVTLTGSDRMRQRPIKILVDALRSLGANIEYASREGFPPLRITGTDSLRSRVALDAGVSSQYISALLLIGPKLKNGLELSLSGKIASAPYINMTLGLLAEAGIRTNWNGNKIIVAPAGRLLARTITVESDWSSASYFYSIIALSPVDTEIELSSFKTDSRQGDRVLAQIYEDFGVSTFFSAGKITLRKTAERPFSELEYNLNDTPDIAQTIAVTAFGLGIRCKLSGLHTLRIKETDRIHALTNELRKLGATVSSTHDTFELQHSGNVDAGVRIDTYDDHRMAMAFAPLALKTDIVIGKAEVVSKSYPAFWEDIKAIGIQAEPR